MNSIGLSAVRFMRSVIMSVIVYGSVFITGMVSAHMAHNKYSDICLLAN